MKKDQIEKLEALNEHEIVSCNGGSLGYQPGKDLFPPIVYPIPDPEEKGRL